MPRRSAARARTCARCASTSRGCWWSCASTSTARRSRPHRSGCVFGRFAALLHVADRVRAGGAERAARAEAVRPGRPAAPAAALLRQVDGDARSAADRRADVPRALEGSRVMATRAEFLGRIRTRGRRRPPGRFAATTAPRPARPGEAAEAVRRQMAERWPEALERFRQEFERVAGVFHRVAACRRGARRRARHRAERSRRARW